MDSIAGLLSKAKTFRHFTSHNPKAWLCRYPAGHESLAIACKIPYLSNYSRIHKSAHWLMLYKLVWGSFQTHRLIKSFTESMRLWSIGLSDLITSGQSSGLLEWKMYGLCPRAKCEAHARNLISVLAKNGCSLQVQTFAFASLWFLLGT